MTALNLDLTALIAEASALTRRAARSLSERGVGSTARRALTLLRAWTHQSLYTDESHVWYAIELNEQRPPVELPAGTELVSLGREELGMLVQLGLSPATVDRAMDAPGTAAWALREAGATVFSCWTLDERVPAVQAAMGWLELAPAVRFLEGSVAAPDQRGRRLAGAVWGVVFGRLRSDGVSAVMTKVEVRNVAARKAVERFGFCEVARTHFHRIAGLRRLQVGVADPRFAWLPRALKQYGSQPSKAAPAMAASASR